MTLLHRPLYPALIFCLAATLWVLFSDALLLHLGLDLESLVRYQQVKGVGFVLLTSLLLYVTLRQHRRAEQRQAENLRRSEERLSLALESAEEGLWDWDLRSNRVFFSPRYCEMLGLNQAEFGHTRQGWEERLHPDDLQPVRQAVQAQLDGSTQRYQTLYRLRHRDGSYRWIRARGRLVADAEGRPQRFIGTSLDVSASRADQEKLRQAEAVFSCTHEGVLITDSQQRITHVNEAFIRITGYSREEVLGANPRLIKSGRHGADFYAGIWQSLAEQGSWSGEIWNRRKNGEVFPLWQSIRSVRDENGTLTHLVAVFSDISAIKHSQREIDFLAHHDPLTALPNRLLFGERLEQAAQQASRSNSRGALLLLDLDHFKHINESLGHSQGDQLLKLVGERLRLCLAPEMTLSRLGGDEFGVICPQHAEAEAVAQLAQALLEQLRQPFVLGGETLFIDASIGISLFPDDGHSFEQLLRNADSALFNAKASGRQTLSFYSQEMTALARQRVRLEAELRLAIEQDQLRVHYQPIHRLADHRLVGVEALVRWEHPQRGLVAPGEFIPIAEACGLIGEIDHWVLRQACMQMRLWQAAGNAPEFVAVNVSSRLFGRGELDARVAEALLDSGLAAECLELEVTESAVMDCPDQAQELLTRLRNLGVRLAIDDFGTGYSSLARLRHLPVHKLKLDRSFVEGLPADSGDAAIAHAVVALGHSLGLRVLAEGIETQAQADFLQRIGCELAQGYWFGRPQAASDLASTLTRAAAQTD